MPALVEVVCGGTGFDGSGPLTLSPRDGAPAGKGGLGRASTGPGASCRVVCSVVVSPTGPGASHACGSQRRGLSQQAPGPVARVVRSVVVDPNRPRGQFARVVRSVVVDPNRPRGQLRAWFGGVVGGANRPRGQLRAWFGGVVGGANRPRGQLRTWFAASWGVPTGPGASCARGSQRRGGCQQAPGPVAHVVRSVVVGANRPRGLLRAWFAGSQQGQLRARLHRRGVPTGPGAS